MRFKQDSISLQNWSMKWFVQTIITKSCYYSTKLLKTCTFVFVHFVQSIVITMRVSLNFGWSKQNFLAFGAFNLWCEVNQECSAHFWRVTSYRNKMLLLHTYQVSWVFTVILPSKSITIKTIKTDLKIGIEILIGMKTT